MLLRRSTVFRYAALLLLVMLAGASTAVLAQMVKDTDGRVVEVRDTSRIISIGGAITETLYALGMEKSIIGIDTTSLYPARAAADKPSVGYMRQLSAEGVLGLRPSLILAVEGSGPKETMNVLKEAHIPMVIVPDVYTADGVIERIRIVATATGKIEQGGCIIERVRSDLDALGRFEKAIQKPKRVMFVLSLVNGRAMVAGKHTAADGIIGMAGAVNAVNDYEGYKNINDESVIAAKPDVILAMEGGGSTVTADSIFGHPSFSVTPAAANRAFISMGGLYLLGFGPRTVHAAHDLATRLYPQLKTEASGDEKSGSSAACPG